MDLFADRVKVLQSESERIKQYLHALPPEALSKPSACTQWQVQDVIAHLVGVAETYANSVSRGLQGDTGPLPGRLPAGQATAALSAESIAQRSIAARQTLGDQLLATFDAANDRLNSLLAGLAPEQREIPCYHPGGIVKAQNFMDLRLKELAVHEWDIRAALEPEAHVSPASIPAIMTTISESIASGSLRWAFWSGPYLTTPVRYHFVVTGTGTQQAGCHCGGQYTPHGRCWGCHTKGHRALRHRDLCAPGLRAPRPGGSPCVWTSDDRGRPRAGHSVWPVVQRHLV